MIHVPLLARFVKVQPPRNLAGIDVQYSQADSAGP